MNLTESQRDNLTMIVEFIGGVIVFLVMVIDSLSSQLIFRIGMSAIMGIGFFIRIKIWNSY